MNINDALKLKIGQTVHCPEDRGEKAYTGKVVSISTTINKNIYGKEYIWITVNRGNSNHVWPSNRLG